MKKILLGNTGIEVSIAGFGVLPMGPSQLALPVEEGAKIIHYALKNGINFLDTAQYYRTYPYISKALETGEFDNVIICSKSLCWDYDGMMEAILEARKEMNREVIDIFLMHEVRSGQLEERAGAWAALKDAKEKGLVRAIGLSTHHIDITKAAASMEDLDVVFPLFNYAGLGIRCGEAFASAEEMYEVIKAGGFTKGGLNFDAKTRRGSNTPEDIFLAYIAGMDAFALGLRMAYKIINDGRIDNFVQERYASYTNGIGKKIVDGSVTMAELEQYALAMGDVTTNISGRQEYLENVMNEIMFGF